MSRRILRQSLLLIALLLVVACGDDEASPSGPGANVIPDPIARYTFDNMLDSVTIMDESGKGNDATLHGTGNFQSGAIGNSLGFNGVDTYVSIPAVLAAAEEMTVTTWVKRGSVENLWERIFDFGNHSEQYMFLSSNAYVDKVRFAITNQGIAGEYRTDAVEDASYLLPKDEWRHVAVVLDKQGVCKLYINAVEVSVETEKTPILVKPKDLGATVNNWLGRSQYSGDPHFVGELDEFRVYDAALTAAQIEKVYVDDRGFEDGTEFMPANIYLSFEDNAKVSTKSLDYGEVFEVFVRVEPSGVLPFGGIAAWETKLVVSDPLAVFLDYDIASYWPNSIDVAVYPNLIVAGPTCLPDRAQTIAAFTFFNLAENTVEFSLQAASPSSFSPPASGYVQCDGITVVPFSQESAGDIADNVIRLN